MQETKRTAAANVCTLTKEKKIIFIYFLYSVY